MAGEIDTTNTFAVGVRDNRVVILKWGRVLTTAEAYNLAAYLVSMAEGIDGERLLDDPLSDYHAFDEWLNAVRQR